MSVKPAGDATSQTAPVSVVAVVGPTAVGKTALSLALAHRFDAEIINADSMQLYRGMDIGTAKLPPAERQGVPHHLLDIWELSHLATVAEYQRLAREQIADIQARGKLAILVGGSGLYINAVIDDLEFPGTDQQIRQRWEEQLEREGASALHAELANLDPVAAERIPAANGRRIVRALEVIELTGQPYSANLPHDRHYLPATLVALDGDRAQLDARIGDRVEAMWNAGLVDEVRVLRDRHGLASAPTASRALGYAQVLALLDGRCDEAEAKRATAAGTRRFSRRQRSWFARDRRTTGFSVESPDLIELVTDHLAPIVK